MNQIELIIIRYAASIALIFIGFIFENISNKFFNKSSFLKGIVSILYIFCYMLGTGCLMFFTLMYFLIFVGLGVC